MYKRQALLGAMQAQLKLGLPSIGGKDSMSGTFEDIDEMCIRDRHMPTAELMRFSVLSQSFHGTMPSSGTITTSLTATTLSLIHI